MDRVTRAEAARQLEVDRATSTREVQKNPALLDEQGMVNVDELRAVRQSTLNPKLQTRGTGAVPQVSTLNASRERTELTKAEIATLLRLLRHINGNMAQQREQIGGDAVP